MDHRTPMLAKQRVEDRCDDGLSFELKDLDDGIQYGIVGWDIVRQVHMVNNVNETTRAKCCEAEKATLRRSSRTVSVTKAKSSTAPTQVLGRSRLRIAQEDGSTPPR